MAEPGDGQAPTSEFTRLKAKIQVGNGPDSRGEITAEVVRGVNQGRNVKKIPVMQPDGSTGNAVEAPVNDALFAEFYYELSRSTRALRQQLGLDDGGNDA